MAVGQLTDTDYQLPAYAQDMLYLVVGDQAVKTAIQTKGKNGSFTLDTASGEVRLAWGTPDGPILTIWDQVDDQQLAWDGRVTVGGFIERLHAHEIGGLEVVIVEVVGGPLSQEHIGLPTLDDMRNGIFARPSDTEPLVSDQCYPFIILAESNLAALAQDAFVSGIAVDAVGTLADDAGQWHEVVGLPLLLESLTLLAP